MNRTLTLEVPEKLYSSIQEVAQQKGQIPEEVALEWLSKITEQQEDPIEPLIGFFQSGHSDWVENHDRYLSQEIQNNHQ